MKFLLPSIVVAAVSGGRTVEFAAEDSGLYRLVDFSCCSQPRVTKRISMNWLAIICAAAAYWILGMIWYAALFGKIWCAGLEQHGVKVQKGGMAAKMIGTFIGNLVAAVIMARLIQRIPVTDIVHGLRLGVGVGVGFSATAITIAYLWESKPFKVWLIDVSYYVLGCVLLGAILSVWH
jgi:biotin transporter BioY